MNAHSFTVGADYRTHAATMTGFGSGAAETLRDVIASDGMTVRGASEDVGTAPPAAGSYYVRVPQFKAASLCGVIRPYDFYVRVFSGSPMPEMEPSDEDAPQAPRFNGWGGRVIGPATAKTKSFAITVNGRDTIGVIVAVDLERGAPVWHVIAGAGVFTGSFIINCSGRANWVSVR